MNGHYWCHPNLVFGTSCLPQYWYKLISRRISQDFNLHFTISSPLQQLGLVMGVENPPVNIQKMWETYQV